MYFDLGHISILVLKVSLDSVCEHLSVYSVSVNHSERSTVLTFVGEFSPPMLFHVVFTHSHTLVLCITIPSLSDSVLAMF